jgi:hypothetical protein
MPLIKSLKRGKVTLPQGLQQRDIARVFLSIHFHLYPMDVASNQIVPSPGP